MGLLRVKGTIDINQFWPTGSGRILSDADTVHVKVNPATSFVFEGNVTRAFDFAWVKTAKNKDGSRSPVYVIHRQTTADPDIVIRLQGIDAPELHYRVDQKKPDVRQNWGKRATLELRNYLKGLAKGSTIECHVETLVQSPNDVFDMYGRFVGDIMVSDGSKFVNVNHWLVENAWAFPTFYNSMQLGEIDSIYQLWAKTKGGMRKSIVNRATDNMYGLPAGKAGDNPAQANSDKGEVVLPKMFRRLVAYKENPQGAKTLAEYLALPKKKKDLVVDLAAFKKLTASQRAHPAKKNSGVPVVKLSTLVSDKNRLDPRPETLVFVEDAADLKNNTGNVTNWNAHGVPVQKL